MDLKTRLQRLTMIFIPLLLVDQITKVWAQKVFKGMSPIIYLKDLFRFEYAENTGAFLSLGSSLDPHLRMIIFEAAVGLFLSYVLYMILLKQLNFQTFYAFILLFSGGVGNLIDRVFRGYVIDFMNVGIGNFRTGIFNVADMAILASLFLIIIPEKKALPENLNQSNNQLNNQNNHEVDRINS